MHILITSGGTSEAIDSVRSITNHSTGEPRENPCRNGSCKGHQVTLITTPTALKPDPHPQLRLLLIQNVEELLTKWKRKSLIIRFWFTLWLFLDYTPVYITGLEEVEKAQDLHSFIHRENQEAKISSKEEYQVLFPKEKSKIISLVKEWNPAIQLIGFKLFSRRFFWRVDPGSAWKPG